VVDASPENQLIKGWGRNEGLQLVAVPSDSMKLSPFSYGDIFTELLSGVIIIELLQGDLTLNLILS
jgi:hypothetical protein